MSYAYQKLKNAVEVLQANRLTKRQWLEGNDVYHVLHLSAEEFPHDVREDFNRLHSDDIIAKMRIGSGSQIDTARSIPDADVERLATQIIELYYHVDAAMLSRAHKPRRAPARKHGSDIRDAAS